MRRRAQRAGELFSIYRVDHAIGCYREFSRPAQVAPAGAEPPAGEFWPPDENDQIQLGERLMHLMGRFGEVIAEDLGTVPGYLRPSLERSGIAGYRVLRWEKDQERYRDPASGRRSRPPTNATHDTDTTAAWWDGLSPDDRKQLQTIPALANLDPNAPFGPTGARRDPARALRLSVDADPDPPGGSAGRQGTRQRPQRGRGQLDLPGADRPSTS